MEQNNKPKTKMSDEELMEMVGGFDVANSPETSVQVMYPLYGIRPGPRPVYGIKPIAQPLYGIKPYPRMYYGIKIN